MRILVTGASGFIGRHCLQQLIDAGYEVHAVDVKMPEKMPAPVKWHQLDLCDYANISYVIADMSPTHLLHFAWFTKPSEYWNSNDNLHWVSASLNLIEQFQLSGGKRIVAAGTCAEYDWNHGYCSDKSTPVLPRSLYGVCKNSLRQILESFSAVTGISSAWGRIFHLYGPYENPNRLVPYIIRSILSGEQAVCRHSEYARDFMYVGDVASAFIRLLMSDVEGPVNIASGNPVKIGDVAGRIINQLGYGKVRFDDLYTDNSEPPLLVADVERLTDELHWHPAYSLDEGLRITIQWWQEQCR